MRNYEVTFIVDPVLSSGEIDATSAGYKDHLTEKECEIVHIDSMGLRQLAYPINKRTSGVYYCIEFTTGSHDVIEGLELALRRDERIMRFITVKLDKYGVKYNEDKRNGLIGKKREDKAESNGKRSESNEKESSKSKSSASAATATATAAAKPASSEEE